MTPVALLVHGAGSCPETALRLLAPAVPEGVEPVGVDGRGTVEEIVARLDAAARASAVALVGGVSLGAHAAALWSARGGRSDELLLVMPAWSGPPEGVAALTAATASEVAERGVDATLARVRAGALDGDWVLEELACGWGGYDAVLLADTLRAASSSTGPTPRELSRITARTAVVALDDDPLHPVAVSRSWAEAIPTAGLAVVGRHEPAACRGALGFAGRQLLDALDSADISGSR